MELSTGTLIATPAQNWPVIADSDVTAYMWPTYRRVTLAQGGDATASFSFSENEWLLERWLHEYLGAEFREVYNGRLCFLGRIHTLRLSVGRTLFATSLDWVFNQVACYYTSIVSNETQVTDFFDDLTSQARWGIRQLIYRPTDYIDQVEAEAVAQRILAESKDPRISKGPIQTAPVSQPMLKVDIQGYAGTLDAQFYHEPSPGQEAATTNLLNTLAGASFVSAGNIADNPKLVTITADYRPKLNRLGWIAEQRDAVGNRYNYGCFASRKLDYQPADLTHIRYRIRTKGAQVQHLNDKEGYVPHPYVQPGGVSFAIDLDPARPYHTTNLLFDRRAQFDASVEYAIQGATLRGLEWGYQERAQAMEMSLIARRPQ